MDLIFIIPVLTIIFLSIYRFLEYKFITHEFKPAKALIQELTIIFLCSLMSNIIFSNLGSNIRDFFNVMTNKPQAILGGETPEIFTENPTF